MAEPPPVPPHPRESFALDGHQAAESQFAEAFEAGRAHHAWMLTGPPGIGKATLAYRMARRALGAAAAPDHGVLGADPDDPVCRRIIAEAHGDLLVLERPFDPKRGQARAEIPVAEARRLSAFFSATASEGGWRVAIIDAADELNTAAANAILKTLEEPPARALIMLVAHAPGRLPPTVRSRCRVVGMRAPGETIAANVALRLATTDAKAARAAAQLSGGRPGAAARLLIAGGLSLHERLQALMKSLPALDLAGAHALADDLAAKGAEDRRALFFAFLDDGVRARAEAAAEAGEADAVDAWLDVWEKLARLQRELDGLHLDPKVTVLEALHLARAAAAAARAPSPASA
ncbi:MAG: DNA polymerase III subunit delta' [Caulobacterales bacterium]|nr:DNA polymerase III subunit delta' [Caulobacterales bacterium]